LFDIATGKHPFSRLKDALELVDRALGKVQPTEDYTFFANGKGSDGNVFQPFLVPLAENCL
jgi:hypothetical protein